MFGGRNNSQNRSEFASNGGGRKHPINQANGQNQNRFSALGNQSRGRNDVNQDKSDQMYGIDVDGLKAELSTERPIWPLSSYGPGRNAPRQLLEAQFEQSPEEMRVLHYLAIANGNQSETAQREATAMEAVNQAIQTILSDVDGAVKYVIEGKDQHPNRIDLLSMPFGSQNNNNNSQLSSGQQQPSSSTFGQTSAFGSNTSTSAFGQPSAVGQGTSFGKPSAFGAAAAAGSAFGRPSSLGSAAPAFGTPAFGQPSQPSGFAAAAQTPAFGQTGFAKPSPFAAAASQPQSTFGQPSVFGATKSSPFATVNSQQTSGTFGQPSAFGAAAANNSQQSQGGTFGQPSAFGAAANKPSPFAAAAANNAQQQQGGTFGQSSGFGPAANKPTPSINITAPTPPSSMSGFGNTGTQLSVFGATPSSSPFGAVPASSSPFGAAPASSSPFAAAAQAQSSPSAAPKSTQSSTPSPFAQAQTKPPGGIVAPPTAGTSFQQNNAPGEHIRKDASGRLLSFKGRPVSYDATSKSHSAPNPNTGKQERIWFPDGPPPAIPDAQAKPESYEGELGKTLENIYLYVKEHGIFENGLIPEIPPKAQWIVFDL